MGDEVCEHCNGEGCLINGKPASEHRVSEEEKKKRADEITRQKVERIEKMIEECEDFDELDRLENALKSGNLDSVLPEPSAAKLEEACLSELEKGGSSVADLARSADMNAEYLAQSA